MIQTISDGGGNFGRTILSSAYFPPIDFFVAMLNSPMVEIEQHENYIKQSYRNRTKILSSNGILSLSLPVVGGGNGHPIKDIKIDYSSKWVGEHKRALLSAYMSSPFFEYYSDDIFSIIDKKPTFLFDLNLEIIEYIVEAINCGVKYRLTEQYLSAKELDSQTVDYRETIHPKKGSPIFAGDIKQKPYYQVFSQKYGFVSGLSVVDLLFNEGTESYKYLLL